MICLGQGSKCRGVRRGYVEKVTVCKRLQKVSPAETRRWALGGINRRGQPFPTSVCSINTFRTCYSDALSSAFSVRSGGPQMKEPLNRSRSLLDFSQSSTCFVWDQHKWRESHGGGGGGEVGGRGGPERGSPEVSCTGSCIRYRRSTYVVISAFTQAGKADGNTS